MRDTALLLFFLFILPFAICHTWVAVLLWTWISLMNPHKLAFGFAMTAPFAAVAAAAALLSLVFNPNRFRLPWLPVTVALVVFTVWMCITTLFAINSDAAWLQLNKVLKIQLMTLVAMIALRKRKHIEWFIWVNVLSIGFYGFKGGIFTLLTSGESRVWGPPGGFIEGNNEVALALVIALPLMNYLRQVDVRRWVRFCMLVLMILSVVAAVGTQSRGAFLALLAMGTMLWMRSRNKLVTGIVVALVGLTVVAFMPQAWEERMRTIQSYEMDTSAMGRINAWWTAYNIASRRLTGGGFEVDTPEIFAQYAPDPSNIKVAHSIYFSVLGEHGFVGLIMFLCVWILALHLSREIRVEAQLKAPQQWPCDLALMCQVSLIGYAVGGAFLSLAYFDLPYNIVVILVATMQWLKVQRGAPQS